MNQITSSILAAVGVFVLSSCGPSGQQQATTNPAGANQSGESGARSAGDLHGIDASVLASTKPTDQPCSLDSIDGNYAKQITVAAGKPHAFRGWLLDTSRQPAGKFSLVLEGKQDYAIAAATGVSRPDVGAYLKDPKFDGAGFEFTSALAALPPGEYKLMLLVEHGSAVHSCDVEKTLTVE